MKVNKERIEQILIDSLPFVTDAIDDPCFNKKGKSFARGLEKRIRNVLEEISDEQ